MSPDTRVMGTLMVRGIGAESQIPECWAPTYRGRRVDARLMGTCLRRGTGEGGQTMGWWAPSWTGMWVQESTHQSDGHSCGEGY